MEIYQKDSSTEGKFKQTNFHKGNKVSSKNYPIKKGKVGSFTGEFYQTFIDQSIPTLPHVSQNTGKEETLPDYFVKQI